MQLEIEREALKKDRGRRQQSERLGVLEKDLANLGASADALTSRWQSEKEASSRCSRSRSQIDAAARPRSNRPSAPNITG